MVKVYYVRWEPAIDVTDIDVRILDGWVEDSEWEVDDAEAYCVESNGKRYKAPNAMVTVTRSHAETLAKMIAKQKAKIYAARFYRIIKNLG